MDAATTMRVTLRVDGLKPPFAPVRDITAIVVSECALDRRAAKSIASLTGIDGDAFLYRDRATILAQERTDRGTSVRASECVDTFHRVLKRLATRGISEYSTVGRDALTHLALPLRTFDHIATWIRKFASTDRQLASRIF